MAPNRSDVGDQYPGVVVLRTVVGGRGEAEMRDSGDSVLRIIGGGVVVVFLLRMGFGVLVEGRSADNAAWVLTVFVLFGVAVIIGMAWLVKTLWGTRAASYHVDHSDDGAISGVYREVPPAAPYLLPPSNVINVPVVRRNGEVRQPVTVLNTVVEDEATHERRELPVSLDAMVKAGQLLSSGKPPTRTNFHSVGVMSNTEVGQVVDFLTMHGWVDKRGSGSPARWKEGATADRFNEWLSTWARE
ncbi:MAG: hypothetical protein M1546_18950 [Chloroflexi bacterium]|nr:hypothetical protein [Chloroflexota bacterium]